VKVDVLHDQFQHIVENSLDGIIIIQEEHPVYVNSSALKMFGYGSIDHIHGVKFVDLMAPASRPFVVSDPGIRPVGSDLMKGEEQRALTKDGQLFDVEVNSRIIEWNGRPGVFASFRDITERKKMEREQARWLWEQETLTTIDHQLVSMVDLQKVLEAISHHAKSLTHADFVGVIQFDLQANSYTWRTMIGNLSPFSSEVFPVLDVHHQLMRNESPTLISDVQVNMMYSAEKFPSIAKEQLQSAGIFPLDVEGRREGVLLVGFRSGHQFSKRDLRYLGSLAKKSSIAIANAKLYENLIEQEKELGRLSSARVQDQEEERRRIAREIHDGLGQMLTAIKFNLEILEDSIQSPAEFKRIEDMKELLDRVMKEAREISYDLMPSVLEDFGLTPALQLLCEGVANRTNLKILFHAHGVTERLAPKIEIGMYRIAQEALNNITKHAQASEVNVQIVRHKIGIRLTVEDNGIGMKTKARTPRADRSDGMGLLGMRQRAVSFNGGFTIDSSPGKGTMVNVEIPLRSEKDGKDPNPSGR
jgi:PAS domain S-box-containing protein